MKHTPCQDPANDPNDWFIERDGRQYHDEPVLTADEVRAIWDAETELADEEGREPDLAGVLEKATAARLKENLRKRRDAKAKCYECPLRTQCLQLGLSSDFVVAQYGTWGGYYTEELRAIQREGRRRRRVVSPKE